MNDKNQAPHPSKGGEYRYTFSVFFSKHLAISRIVCVFLQCGMEIIKFWNYFAKLLNFSNICKFSCHFF